MKNHNSRFQNVNVVGLGLTKTDDDYEVAIKFADGSFFRFNVKFTASEGCTATVGFGDFINERVKEES